MKAPLRMMFHGRVLVAGSLFCACATGNNSVPADSTAAFDQDGQVEAPDPNSKPGPASVWATAGSISMKDLGLPVDENFQPIRGVATVFQPRLAPEKRHDWQRELTFIEDTTSLAANAGGWGISGELANSKERRYASFRAEEIKEVYSVEDQVKPKEAPDNAVYYLAQIALGHSYEVVVSGSETDFHAGAKAQLAILSAGLDSFAKKQRLEMKAFGKGLKPKDGSSIFAKEPEQVEHAYVRNRFEPSHIASMKVWWPGQPVVGIRFTWATGERLGGFG